MKPGWYDEAVLTCRNTVDNRVPGGLGDIRFLALAIGGETGEMQNLIKKDWRGDEIDWDRVREELADMRAYMEYLARAIDGAGVTTDDYVEKFAMPKMGDRWPDRFGESAV